MGGLSCKNLTWREVEDELRIRNAVWSTSNQALPTKDTLNEVCRQILAGDKKGVPTIDIEPSQIIREQEDLHTNIRRIIQDLFNEGPAHDKAGTLFVRLLLAHARAYWFFEKVPFEEGKRLYGWTFATLELE